jgi:hypothetical protein
MSSYVPVRWSFLLGLLIILLKSSYDLLTHPAVVSTAGAAAWFYLGLFTLALGIYGGAAWFLLRPTTRGQHIAAQQGTICGLLCGGVWLLEVLVANSVIGWVAALNPILYYGLTFTGYLLPGLAALLAARRAGLFSAGVRAGLLTGMFGGLLLFLATIFLLTPLWTDAGLHDPQTIAEFQHSGLPDLQTFLIGDALAGMVAHLWIGLITGLVLGAAGGGVGHLLAPAQPSAPGEDTPGRDSSLMCSEVAYVQNR